MGQNQRGRHAAKKEKASEPMKVRATAFLVRHPVVTTCMLTLVVFVALVVLLWYTVFSGLASSADFIYSNF